MKIIAKLIITLFILIFFTMAWASQYSVYIINHDSENSDGSILIDYTICSNILEKDPICSEHKKKRIYRNSPEEFELKNESEVLYVWSATTYDSMGVFMKSNYSRESQRSNKKPLLLSDCATTARRLLILDSYRTRRVIGCEIIISGQYYSAE